MVIRVKSRGLLSYIYIYTWISLSLSLSLSLSPSVPSGMYRTCDCKEGRFLILETRFKSYQTHFEC